MRISEHSSEAIAVAMHEHCGAS